MRRPLASVLVAVPAVGAGTLAAHAAAYRLAGAPADGVHAYLAHVPQVLVVLALPALVAAAMAGRAPVPPAWPFALAALATFAAQEHVERLAHTGQLPLLLDRPVFWLGLALQVPFALAAWGLARWALRAAPGPRARRPPAASSLLVPVPTPPAEVRHGRGARHAAPPRAPPVVLPAR